MCIYIIKINDDTVGSTYIPRDGAVAAVVPCLLSIILCVHRTYETLFAQINKISVKL